MSTTRNASAQYLASGDPALKDYYPAWVNNMADDATVEGSMLDGVVEGADAVRSRRCSSLPACSPRSSPASQCRALRACESSTPK